MSEANEPEADKSEADRSEAGQPGTGQPAKPRRSKSDRLSVRLLDYPLSWAVWVLFAISRLLSEKMLLRVGKFFGNLFWLVMPRRRHIARRNLDIAYGDAMTDEEKYRIAKASAQHSARVVTSLTFLRRWWRDPELESRVTIAPEDEEVIAPLRGGSHAVLTAHIGNWEVGRLFMDQRGIPLTAIERGLRHRRTSRVLFGDRSLAGKVISHDAQRELWDILESEQNVAIVADQNNRRRAIFADFFGVPASSYLGYAGLLVRARYRIVFMSCMAVPEEWRWHMFVRELYSPAPGAAPPRGAERKRLAAKLVQDYLAVVEEVAREYPEQYVWVHRRWRARPAGAPKLYDNLGEPLSPELRAAAQQCRGEEDDTANDAAS